MWVCVCVGVCVCGCVCGCVCVCGHTSTYGMGSELQAITCAEQERMHTVFLILHKLPSCSGVDLGTQETMGGIWTISCASL